MRHGTIRFAPLCWVRHRLQLSTNCQVKREDGFSQSSMKPSIRASTHARTGPSRCGRKKSKLQLKQVSDVPRDPATTITVPSSVARRLRLYKTGGRTYAEVLADLMDAVPPRSFIDWAERELKRPTAPYSEIRRRLALDLA